LNETENLMQKNVRTDFKHYYIWLIRRNSWHLVYLLTYLSRYLDQKTAKCDLFGLLLLLYNHSKVELIPLSALSAQQANLPTCSPHNPVNAERQAEKL